MAFILSSPHRLCHCPLSTVHYFFRYLRATFARAEVAPAWAENFLSIHASIHVGPDRQKYFQPSLPLATCHLPLATCHSFFRYLRAMQQFPPGRKFFFGAPAWAENLSMHASVHVGKFRKKYLATVMSGVRCPVSGVRCPV